MPKLDTGDKAPEFNLKDQDGNDVSLAEFKGEKVILYFYPKDDTPGCTTQACDFRDSLERISAAGFTVLGVSKDGAESHQKFIEKYSIPYTLLTDPENEVGKSYGAFGEKTMYGKKTVGVIRSTFVIDEGGKIERAYYNVKAAGHVDKLRGDLGLA